MRSFTHVNDLKPLCDIEYPYYLKMKMINNFINNLIILNYIILISMIIIIIFFNKEYEIKDNKEKTKKD